MGTRKSKVRNSTQLDQYIILIYDRPCNHKELFKLRHAQLRNVVKRIFGAAKKKFKIFQHGTNFDTKKQAELILAFTVIFNFIHIYDPQDPDCEFDPKKWKEQDFDMATGLTSEDRGDEGDLSGQVGVAERRAADERREEIAQAMWESYQAYQSTRQ